MNARFLLSAALATAVLVAKPVGERPRFNKALVIPHGHWRNGPVTRGQFVTIYGDHLKPARWCGKPHTQQAPYPAQLCGVRVTIGSREAGLMYVGRMGGVAPVAADRINFQVPSDGLSTGTHPLAVCVGKLCSEPVDVEFVEQDIWIRVSGTAYARMPVWIDVESPLNPLPYWEDEAPACPGDFRGYWFEMRQNGRPVSLRSFPGCRYRPGPSAIRRPGRFQLPLHLVHPFESPGVYQVRVGGPVKTPDLTKVARNGYSDWLQVVVEPYSPEDRERWIQDILRNPKPFPNPITELLAWPDEKALDAVLRRLAVGPGKCDLPAILSAFPRTTLLKRIPKDRLARLLEGRQPCN